MYTTDLYSREMYTTDLYSTEMYSTDLYSTEMYSTEMYYTTEHKCSSSEGKIGPWEPERQIAITGFLQAAAFCQDINIFIWSIIIKNCPHHADFDLYLGQMYILI